MPVVLFAVLAVATIFAFYLTQHLKVQNPLINGSPRADPAVINPQYAGMCVDAQGDRVSFRHTKVGFYLQSRSDTAFVTVIDPTNGDTVATMSGSGRHLIAKLNKYYYFRWDGKLTDGQYAPAGTYTFQVALKQEGRTLPITGASVQVQSGRPAPRVTAITVSGAKPAESGTAPSFAPGHGTVTLGLRTGKDIGVNVLVYRASTNRAKPLTLVKSFGINPRHATWDGMINGAPAPAGTYVIGLSVTDRSCTHGQFPETTDPAPGTTSGAGVNISYLSADPPVDPVSAGQVASVGVRAADGRYTWTLRMAGGHKVLARSNGASGTTLHVRLPTVGLYELRIVSEGRSTTVPLIASATGARASAKVLVVLPALSWEGADATDDDGDGLIDTLANGSQVSLERPLVAGLPSGVDDEAALLRFLNEQGYRYDLTTDVALAEGVGPSLKGRSGVLLDGTFRWLPSQLVSQLHGFVKTGGGVFADGIRSLQAKAEITDGNYGPIAKPATVMATDPFGVTHGPVAASNGQIIASFTDSLDLFGDTFALQVPRYEVLEPAAGHVVAAAGVSENAPAIIGFPLGRGTVVEAGLANFGLGLASDPDLGELLGRVWQAVLR